MSETQRLRLKVVGDRTIHCAGCESTIEFTLSKLPGVTRVSADRERQEIELELADGEPELDQVEAELEWIGYEVQTA